jgi:hypothetical protein
MIVARQTIMTLLNHNIGAMMSKLWRRKRRMGQFRQYQLMRNNHDD